MIIYTSVYGLGDRRFKGAGCPNVNLIFSNVYVKVKNAQSDSPWWREIYMNKHTFKLGI